MSQFLHSLRLSRDLIQLAAADLSAKDLVRVPRHKGNPAAFILGHLIWIERFIGPKLGIEGFPELNDKFIAQFARGKKPPLNNNAYGDPLALRDQFLLHRDHTLAMLESAPPELFSEPLQSAPGPLVLFATVGELANFLGIHAAMHAGQLTMIRRSLGRKPMF